MNTELKKNVSIKVEVIVFFIYIKVFVVFIEETGCFIRLMSTLVNDI